MSLFGKSQRDAEPPDGSKRDGRYGRDSRDGGDRLGARPASAPRSAEQTRTERAVAQAPERGGETVANIGKSISIKGDLSGNEDLQIEGSVEGRIDLPSNQLTIGSDGKVKADVHAKSVIVIGHVNGNVTATERIEVEASGVVDGDVRAPRLVVQEGAVLNGAVEMGESTAAKTGGGSGAPKPPAPAPKVAAGGGEAA